MLFDNWQIARNLTDKLWVHLSIVPADVVHSSIFLYFPRWWLRAKILSDNWQIARNLTDKLWVYPNILPPNLATHWNRV